MKMCCIDRLYTVSKNHFMFDNNFGKWPFEKFSIITYTLSRPTAHCFDFIRLCLESFESFKA